MTAYSDFKNPGFKISGSPIYKRQQYGIVESGNIYINVKNVPSKIDNVYYSGQPVYVSVVNDVLVVEEIGENKDANAIIVPTQIAPADVEDKTNESIVYKTFDTKANELVGVVIPNNNDIKGDYKTTEKVAPNAKITFAKDANNIVCVKTAGRGDKVYGIVDNKSSVNAGELARIKLLNFNNLEVLS